MIQSENEKNAFRSLCQKAKAWPFEEARALLEAVKEKDCVVFETGYGPSGLPHIGTFGEVARTTMVRHAFSCLSSQESKLLCVSDDMDGLRKVPGNVPEQEQLKAFLNHPLTKVPDPFKTHKSFGESNNARLCAFLDSFGFDYTFVSATKIYQDGVFDDALLLVLKHHQAILDVVLPTLGPDRQKTYSPFLPVSPATGELLQVAITEYCIDKGTIVFQDVDGKRVELSVLGGNCKLQWKVDWGMRWFAFGVDYEMSGKDLIDSVTLSSQICQILGKKPPLGLPCEHFLDAQGRKISKSVGNGLSIEEWLTYAPQESLAYFMYLTPWRAKRLSFDIIPKCMDEYLAYLAAFGRQSVEEKLENPVWHVHRGNVPDHSVPMNFSMLLNLASVCQAEDSAALWRFVQRYAPEATPETQPFFDRMVHHAIQYFQDFVKPLQKKRQPRGEEISALQDLCKGLRELSVPADQDSSEVLQSLIYEVGNKHFSVLKDWFSALYQIFLGQNQGPRMGSFIQIYGIDSMIQLIEKTLAQ
jgi:lysyl-tRNA synthetase, class I